MHPGRKMLISLYVAIAVGVLGGVTAASANVISDTATVPVPVTTSAQAKYVVVIDAGHQGVRDSRMEPIGPGSKTKKPAVTSGTSGKVTHIPEQRTNLKVALKVRDLLVAQGVKVVMVRTKEKVDITNSQRAKIANAAHADLFIRLHCDGNNNSAIHGISVLTPGKNKWTGPIVARSKVAAKFVSHDLISATKAQNRGVTARTDLAGFNWCKVPTVLVEMGFMSNRTEDKLLANGTYQNKLAAGLARGALDYLATTR